MKLNKFFLIILINFNFNNFAFESFSSVTNYIKGRADQDRSCFAKLCNGEFFFGLFDGHGKSGHFVAEYSCKYFPEILNEQLKQEVEIENALRFAYQNINKKCDINHSGCTAVTAVIQADKLYIANVGDSKAVLSYKGQAQQLSYDHKPRDQFEKDRICRLGGDISDGRLYLESGHSLAMTRSIWDKDFWPYVISDPFINIVNLDDNCEFLILATDGVWDVVDIDKAVEIVSNSLKKNKYDLHEAAEALTLYAWRCYSKIVDRDKIDDITVKLICFNVEKQLEKLAKIEQQRLKEMEEEKEAKAKPCYPFNCVIS